MSDEASQSMILQWFELCLWLATLAGGVFGAYQMWLVHISAESAPQQAAGTAMAVAYAVIPYVTARAAQQFRKTLAS